MNRVFPIYLAFIILMMSACSSQTQPKVSEAEIATRVAILKLTSNPVQGSQNSGIILATVQGSTQQLTATVTTTPTKPASDPVTWLGAATWRDAFSGTNNFYTTSDEYVQFTYSGDAFNMAAVSGNDWHSWSLTNRLIRNFYLEALLKVGTCSGNDKYGLVFRAPDYNQGYFYGITCDGRFSLTRWDSMDLLINWKPAVPLHSGPNQTNRVGVMAQGNEFTLYINGVQVDKINNDRYTEGMFGFFIAAINTIPFNVLVDEVAYWNQ